MQPAATIINELKSLPLRQSQPAIYDRPIGLQLLLQDPVSGAEHYIVRYPAGLEARTHWHSAAQTIIVIEGHLVVNGQNIGPGSYCHIPANQPMHHVPVQGEPCLFVTIFHGPFDVEPLAG